MLSSFIAMNIIQCHNADGKENEFSLVVFTFVAYVKFWVCDVQRPFIK